MIKNVVRIFSALLRSKKSTSFIDVEEPIYLRWVKAFYAIVVVDQSNFTIKATLKGIDILILEHILEIILKVPKNNKIFYDGWFEIPSLRRDKVIKKLKELKDNELKSKALNSFGRLVYWICMHYVLPKVGTFQEVSDKDLLVIYCL